MKRLALLILFVLTASQSYAQVPLTSSDRGRPFSCSLDNIAATLTLCQLAPQPGEALYIRQIVAQSTTATGGQWILRYGTGTNCGTGTATLFPSAAGANVRLGAPGNTAAPALLIFADPVKVPESNDLCAIGVATNTLTIQVWGYVAAR